MARKRRANDPLRARFITAMNSRKLLAGHAYARHTWAGHVSSQGIGAKPHSRDLKLIAFLEKHAGGSPEMAGLIPQLKRGVPERPLRIELEHASQFVWFERLVLGTWAEEPALLLPAAIVVMCHEVQIPLTLSARQPWRVTTTLCSAWINNKRVSESGGGRWDATQPIGYRELLDELGRRIADVLHPFVSVIQDDDDFDSDEILARHEATFQLRAPPAHCDPDGKLFELADGAVAFLTEGRGPFDRGEVFEYFDADDEGMQLSRATVAEMAQIRAWMDDATTKVKPPSERPAVQSQHSVVIIRDRCLQKHPAGRIIGSTAPPKKESDWIHWAFCVDKGTSTFYVEPFIPSVEPLDYLEFLGRAWSPEGSSPLKQRPQVVEVPSSHLPPKLRQSLTGSLARLGVEVASPQKGGGRAIALAKNWAGDMEYIGMHAAHESVESLRAWSDRHAASILLHNLCEAGVPWVRRESNHEWPHHTRVSSVLYLDFCRAMGLDVEAERDRLTRLLGTSERHTSQTAPLLQLHISIRGARVPIWRRVQISIWGTLSDVHRAVCDTLAWDLNEGYEFTIPLQGDLEGKVLRDGSLHSGRASDVHFLSDHFGSPGQQATYQRFGSSRWVVDLQIDDVVLVPRVEGSPPGPRCIGGEGAAPLIFCDDVQGHNRAVAIIADPQHRDWGKYQSLLIEFGLLPYDPSTFVAESIEFTRAEID